ncbi:MAG: TIGR02186 family protein [Alphaproteobacteria bacterium]|nr:TIGR02186 family protein [Alphaproteobacteria bacterium]
MTGRILKMLLLAMGLGLAALPGALRAQELVADSSRHLVAITTGFVGTEVLLFGATEGAGDVVLVVRGPSRNEVVRRKGRHGGIWINDSQLTFKGVPSFYWHAASKPIETLLRPAALRRHGIGVQFLRLPPGRDVSENELADFRAGFIRRKVLTGLFTVRPRDVTFLGQRLFRSAIYLPPNVPTGSYTINVYLVRQGRVVSAQTVPLSVHKIGISAKVYQFAHTQSVLYGILAIVIALAGGLLAGVIFRRA